MKKIYCIYHSRDFDGMASGAIVKKHYPDAIMIGYDYGQQIPYDQIDENCQVIMVDVSLTMNEMVELAMHTRMQFTWIDHHQSAIADYQELKASNPTYASYITPVLQQGIAACEITWKHFNTGVQMPIAISLLGQYDTWRNENQVNWNMLVLPFQYGLKCWDIDTAQTFPESLLGNDQDYIKSMVNNIVKDGNIVLAYQKKIDAGNMQSSFETTFEGLKAICCNGAGLGSMAFESVWDESKYDLMIPFKFNGTAWTFSLYTTKENIDCSLLAKKYGGGGHQKASGFITDVLPGFISTVTLKD